VRRGGHRLAARDLENAKGRNRRLESDLAASRRRLGEVIGQDILSQVSAPGHPSTAERAGQLEQAHSGAQEALAQRTEELEAARQINRELMARLNRESRRQVAHNCARQQTAGQGHETQLRTPEKR
jgi:hypothetical protein